MKACGEQCVIVDGVFQMQRLFVDNLDSLDMVLRKILRNNYY